MKKKNYFRAVLTAAWFCLAILCVSCADEYSDGLGKPIPRPDVSLTSCEVTSNTYQGSGVITTRAASDIEQLDGKFTAVSRHKAVFYIDDILLQTRTYSGTNIIEARGVLKPRYAKTLDSFKEQNLTMSEQVFKNGQIGRFITFKDGTNHNFNYSFIIENQYEADTFMIHNPFKDKFEILRRCMNEIVDLKFLSQKVTDLERDSAGWHAYSLVHSYAGMLSEGPNNSFQYDMNIPLLWVWKGNGDPDFPDDELDIVVWEDGDEGFDFVNDSTSQSWKDIIPRYSDGSQGKPDRIAVLLKNTIEEPDYQIKQVEDLTWNGLDIHVFDEVTEGERFDKENKISVQAFVQIVQARTDKANTAYKLRREGRPIFTDSLGGKHYLPEKMWTAKNKSWNDEDMTDLENFKRKLLTNMITATFNEHKYDASGKIELRMLKGTGVELIDYEYGEFGIRAITPNILYYTFCTQYAVFSNGNKEKIGEIGTNLNINTVAPEKQEVIVNDWIISDETIQKFNAVGGNSRQDSVSTGVFTISQFSNKNVTRTNKSKHSFNTTYDGGVVFKDKFNNEIKFKALNPSFADNGGVNTLTVLTEENNFERKQMTSTFAVTALENDVLTHTAEVIFKKKVETEELISWDTEQTLIPAGNGLWISTSTIIYNYKLAGTKKSDPIVLPLEWSIVGEAKSQIILANAEAPYVAIDEGNWGNATSSNPQSNVTVYTSKKTISENYTNLTDKYTATMQTAKYSATVEGKTIEFDFLAPTSMSVSHKDGSLVNGNRTTTKNGATYNIWDHTGSVTAVVSSASDSQSQDAIVEKEVLVKKDDVRPNTDYDVDALERFLFASKVYNNNGWADAVMFLTKTHCFTVVDSYTSSGTFVGRTTSSVERSRVIVNGANGIVYDPSTGLYIPALIVTHQRDGGGWTCEGFIDGRSVCCDRSNTQAVSEGIKNFVTNSTSVPTPFITAVNSTTSWWQDKPFIKVSWKTSTTASAVTVGCN